MATPEGLKTKKRVTLAIPLLLAVVVVAGFVIYGWSHFIGKQPAPQRHASPAEVATAQTPPSRGPYEPADDFVEPRRE